MKVITFATYLAKCLLLPTAVMLSGCEGIFNGIYDEPATRATETKAGQLYIDASDWEKWHYIDLKEVAEKTTDNPGFNTSSLWNTYCIPTPKADQQATDSDEEEQGIYTYWYDIYGEGIARYEYQGFAATERQSQPENWTFAVHRNNVRTNGGAVAETEFTSFAQLPEGEMWLSSLTFVSDRWNQTDVWTLQDRMLSGIIGNQGIYINPVLSGWLAMEIPPMPPTFVLNRHVFILRLPDGTYAALQLSDYMDSAGTKCKLTINYKYPL